MGRPHKATVDYFPHFCNKGKTLFVLQTKFGNDGYAFWFKLLSLLGQSDGHYFDYNDPTDWEFLLAETDVNAPTALNILATLVELKAIDRDLAQRKIIWCQNFVNNVADVYKRRQTPLPEKPEADSLKPKRSYRERFKTWRDQHPDEVLASVHDPAGILTDEDVYGEDLEADRAERWEAGKLTRHPTISDEEHYEAMVKQNPEILEHLPE